MEGKSKSENKNLWRGRVDKEINKDVQQFISSIEEDRRILEIDIDVVEAHCLMLHKQGYISKEEIRGIIDGLECARKDYREGKLTLDTGYFNDIHPFLEKYVIDRYGIGVGGKMHLGKSRNDQVMADVRISLRNEIIALLELLLDFIVLLLSYARKYKKVLMPGYTHLQIAQVTTFGYYILSHADAMLRNIDRLFEIYQRVNLNPLGASALSGTIISIDRSYTTALLGFDDIIENTIDATSNRDFILELASELGILMVTLSRIAEDFILWSTNEFNMVELNDEVCDISSVMPQKKNPDPLEIIRGKTSAVIGLITQLFSVTKALPTGYARDLQEMKPAMWKIIDIAKSSIIIMKIILETVKIKSYEMEKLVRKSYALATDLAEFLVSKKNLSFREANFLVGNIVKRLYKEKKTLLQLTPQVVKKIGKELLGKEINISKKEITEIIEPSKSILKRRNAGYLSPEEVESMVSGRYEIVEKKRKMLSDIKEKLKKAHEKFIFAKNQLMNTTV
jgi:argininosuccinate lyase